MARIASFELFTWKIYTVYGVDFYLSIPDKATMRKFPETNLYYICKSWHETFSDPIDAQLLNYE